MRCNIGCGCGKARKNRIARNKASFAARAKLKLRAKRLAANPKALKAEKLRLAIQAQRGATCGKCPHSIQTPIEKRSRMRICHKTKKKISVIILSQDFKLACPIGKFK